MKSTIVTAIACIMAFIPIAQSAELGDPAAELALSEFVQGDSVTLAEGKGKNIYVVEFWATWCPPCRTSIPHLTELQKKYEKDGVIFIAVTDEERSDVAPFIETMGETMQYRVALDDANKTATGYMGAYGQNGIPTAFIVDREGRVAWFGSPMGDLDSVLSDVIDGSYDVLAVREEARHENEAMKEFETYINTIETGAIEDVYTLANKYLERDDIHYSLYANAGWALINHQGIENPDYNLAQTLITRALKDAEGKDRAPHSLYNYALARAYHLDKDIDNAITYQRKALELETDDRMKSNLEEVLTQFEQEKAGIQEPTLESL